MAVALSAGCTVDFVALREDTPAARIDVWGEHTDSLRAEVLVQSVGSAVSSAGVNGEVRFAQTDAVGHATLRLAVTVETTTPFLDVHLDLPADTSLVLRLSLLSKTGEATCAPGGRVLLPVRYDGPSPVTTDRSWELHLLDDSGTTLTTLKSREPMPRPLYLGNHLITDSVALVRVWALESGPIEEVPFSTFLTLATIADLPVSGPCPE